jgi:hypothetical protein
LSPDGNLLNQLRRRQLAQFVVGQRQELLGSARVSPARWRSSSSAGRSFRWRRHPDPFGIRPLVVGPPPAPPSGRRPKVARAAWAPHDPYPPRGDGPLSTHGAHAAALSCWRRAGTGAMPAPLRLAAVPSRVVVNTPGTLSGSVGGTQGVPLPSRSSTCPVWRRAVSRPATDPRAELGRRTAGGRWRSPRRPAPSR